MITRAMSSSAGKSFWAYGARYNFREFFPGFMLTNAHPIAVWWWKCNFMVFNITTLYTIPAFTLITLHSSSHTQVKQAELYNKIKRGCLVLGIK